MKRALQLITLLLAGLCWTSVAQAAAGAEAILAISPGGFLLAWLFPVGVALVMVGISAGWSINRVAVALPLALALAVLTELLLGLGLHYGGTLWGAEWQPLGPGWGLVGLAGVAPSADALASLPVASAMLYDLPLLAVALLPPLVVLDGLGPSWLRYVVALICGSLIYPVAGNWVDGGGWAQSLGATLGLGAGFVDAGRLSLPFATTLTTLGVALALPREAFAADEPAELGAAYLPLHVLLGGVLAWIGWVALTQRDGLNMNALLAVLWGLAGAVLFSAFYDWLVRGALEPGLLGRGMLAGLVVVSAAGSDLTGLVAFALGALAGLAVAPLIYLFDRSLRLREQSGLLALFGALAGLALLVPGVAGDSSGVLTGHGPAQLYAQLLGLSALMAWGGVLPWAVAVVARALATLPRRLAERAAQEQQALDKARSAASEAAASEAAVGEG